MYINIDIYIYMHTCICQRGNADEHGDMYKYIHINQ